jgi:hypothetical protein
MSLRRSIPTLVLDGWAVVLAVLLCLPAFTHGGYGLAADLVFSPRQPQTWDTVGMGERLPRAVPLDAVVGLLGAALPGSVLFRVGIVAGMVLAGCGVHRLIGGGSLASRWVAVTLAIWNPYVVERLALGQWALLLAYGALFFVAAAALDARSGGSLARVWLWVGVASLTPTGGLLATAIGVTLAARRSVRTLIVSIGCLLLQLPWLLPSLLRGAGTGRGPDLELFGARADAPGGVLVSVLGMGGIWDRLSVPTSRTTLFGTFAAALVVLVVVFAASHPRTGWPRLHVLGLGAIVVAVAPTTPLLADSLGWLVAHAPGGGLLRDSQKWLAPWVLLTATSAGVSVDRALAWVGRRDVGLRQLLVVLFAVTPFVLLPDAPSATWDTVRPVTYPADFARVSAILTSRSDSSLVALLPLRAYRQFDWGGERTAHDPAYAWFDASLVGSDELVVGRGTTRDGGGGAALVEHALAAPDPAIGLADAGVRWVVLYRKDPDTPTLNLDGLQVVHDGREVALLRVPGEGGPPSLSPSWQRALVVAVDTTLLLCWLGCLVAVFRGRRAGRILRSVR